MNIRYLNRPKNVQTFETREIFCDLLYSLYLSPKPFLYLIGVPTGLEEYGERLEWIRLGWVHRLELQILYAFVVVTPAPGIEWHVLQDVGIAILILIRIINKILWESTEEKESIGKQTYAEWLRQRLKLCDSVYIEILSFYLAKWNHPFDSESLHDE